ncbi:hypothetical protein [Epilithonimonas sp. UC225_85]|uniref:hypothetical protein n=1 Tax=Epilithonimonas sp. UC225_85 TaxID=3350167 RepID=UPI0036D252F9
MEKTTKKLVIATKGILEVYFWAVVSLLVGGRPFYWGIIRRKMYYDEFFMDFYIEIVFAILVFLFPFLFNLIYAEFPFEYFRNRKNRFRSEEIFTETKDIEIAFEKKELTNKIQETSKQNEVYLEKFLFQSKQIADKLYSRAGAYLLIGCLIAFAGVLFFYFQAANIHNTLTPIIKDLPTSRMLFEYLPRIGTLIFVEAIAFFFLKQYRVTMNEYRYYEAIKRQRENQLTILNFFEDYKDTPDLFEKLISSLGFADNPNKLENGDTTTIIESSKINPNDFEILDKLSEFLKFYKKGI